MKEQISPAAGSPGIPIAGLGAAATTFITGVDAVKKELEWRSFYFKSPQHAPELRRSMLSSTF